MNKVYFVGAGPGDPDLITLKGIKLIKEADVIIYAGSLVNKQLLVGTKAQLYDSSQMELEEIVRIMVDSSRKGKKVVRLHSGDPTIYSAIGEQIERLREERIDYEIVPGVSSVFAGSAKIGIELTLPEISQTVILTRAKGKTIVPEKESLSQLGQHNATMVIFLSASLAEKVQEELLVSYSPHTPVAIVEKVSWPEERIIFCDLKDLAHVIKQKGIKKTTLIYVGKVLEAKTRKINKRSKLYGKKEE
ncbi:MAG: precorrin-4 C(11)-methyltransferase [Deltaproteobacteria bacterium]|nr:precorrin-4 C(11)-methyltransferase [Deltaproteobacteria bacterium]